MCVNRNCQSSAILLLAFCWALELFIVVEPNLSFESFRNVKIYDLWCPQIVRFPKTSDFCPIFNPVFRTDINDQISKFYSIYFAIFHTTKNFQWKTEFWHLSKKMVDNAVFAVKLKCQCWQIFRTNSDKLFLAEEQFLCLL